MSGLRTRSAYPRILAGECHDTFEQPLCCVAFVNARSRKFLYFFLSHFAFRSFSCGVLPFGILSTINEVHIMHAKFTTILLAMVPQHIHVCLGEVDLT